MLGRLVLLLVQVAVGWFAANALMGAIKLGAFSSFSLWIFAVIAAITIYLIGIIAAQVLKDVGAPSSAALTSSLILALIATAAAIWGPQIIPAIGQVPDKALILAGAIIGYHVRR